MSASSGTTLISPSATSVISRAQAAPQPQRKVSGHNVHTHAHGHHTSHGHAHHPKRKTTGPSTGRRGSETEAGKRALAAGLAMHVLDAPEGKGKRRVSTDKPLKKSSRSDTHLPRLSRTTSMTSNASEQVASRPNIKDRKRSGQSVQIVDENGAEVVNGDGDEEGWEESGDEDGQVQIQPASSSKSKGKTRFIEESTPMRRTQSDTQAQPPSRSRSITTSPLALQAVGSGDLVGSGGSGGSTASGRALHPRQRTLGFAGPHAVGDPQTNAQRHINEVMPHWNDSMHVRPAHQVKHQKSLSALSAMQEGVGMNRSASGHGHGRGHEHESTRKQSLPNGHEGVQETEDESGQIQMTRSHGTSPKSNAKPPAPVPTSQPMTDDTPRAPRHRFSAPPEAEQHHRQVSAVESSHRIKHRASNSSMRSLQSLRAPPHPLNSPTGYRSGLPASRSGSSLTSPIKDRGPSMHHPPIAPPVVYREVATGHGWDIPEDEEYATPIVRSVTLPNGPNGASSPGPASARLHQRQVSASSTKSLHGLLRPQASPSSSTSSHLRPPGTSPRRRQTALEQTTKAAKYASTTDPILHHHSLGHSATSAETAHLISRFLPQRKVTRPKWEISVENLDTHSGIGLSRGDYRDAHESLIRSMRELGANQGVNKTASRRLSYQSLLGSRDVSTPRAVSAIGDGDVDGPGVSVGMVVGRNGPMVVARGGGWKGKTPFELSVERCLAQRPFRPLGT